MPSWMIAFSLGIVVAGFAPELPAPRFLALFTLLPLLSLRFPRVRLAGAFSLGLWWALLAGWQAVDDLLPKALERQDIWVEGRVVALPQDSGRAQRFAFEVARWCPAAELAGCAFVDAPRLRRRILLSHYGPEAIAPAQRWRVKVRLRRPHGFANPGGFDYEAWLFQQKISAVGYIRQDPGNALLDAGEGSWSFESMRHGFRQRLARLFPPAQGGLRQAALIKALTTGDHYDLTQAQWDLFTATGTNHLVVISGLHITLAALLGYQAAVLALKVFPGLMLRVAAPRLGAGAAVLTAFVYSGLAGFSLPVQRSLVMVLALMAGRLCNRQTTARDSLCLAFGLITALDPLAPQNVGFWLSFVAVAVLLWCAAEPAAERSWLGAARALVLAQLVVSLGLLPLMLVFFQQTSLAAPLVNLVAIPLVSLLAVPLCLLGLCLLWIAPGLARLAFLGADQVLSLLMWGLEAVVRALPIPLLDLPALAPLALALLAGGVALGLSPLRPRLRAVGLAGLLPLFLARPEALPPGAFRLHVLDVGQGLAVVVETAAHRLVYDTGPAFSPRFDAGRGVVLPFLRARNLTAVDTVMVSHGDLDHAGGLAAVLRKFPTARYLGGEEGIFPAIVDSALCRPGMGWRWDGVDFLLLHPDRAYRKGNDASCVLWIGSGNQGVLLAGDIEAGVERGLVMRERETLRADVLVAPHHGSRSSSTPAFVKAVAPRWVVYSSGYLNRFGHPAGDVQARYRRAGARGLNTARSGAISFLLTGEGEVAPPRLWRATRRRFWSNPPEND